MLHTPSPQAPSGTLATKHALVAHRGDDAAPLYLNAKATALTESLGEAILFKSAAVASRTLNKLLAQDFERKNGVKLLLGEVTLSLALATTPVAKPMASGFVLRRKDGQYFRGPKSRDANSFQEAHYGFVPNPDVATVFKTEQQAKDRAQGIVAQLRETAERMSNRDKPLYLRLVDEGACELIPV